MYAWQDLQIVRDAQSLMDMCMGESQIIGFPSAGSELTVFSRPIRLSTSQLLMQTNARPVSPVDEERKRRKLDRREAYQSGPTSFSCSFATDDENIGFVFTATPSRNPSQNRIASPCLMPSTRDPSPNQRNTTFFLPTTRFPRSAINPTHKYS
ncbi:hypothetical protein DENSPDRAFT_664369 [Dentipellis sp. KUC8613]|nr:hypothetical protein DENSPDRAFT_664369 [Dentipellis sp. KUC8613]